MNDVSVELVHDFEPKKTQPSSKKGQWWSGEVETEQKTQVVKQREGKHKVVPHCSNTKKRAVEHMFDKAPVPPIWIGSLVHLFQ